MNEDVKKYLKSTKDFFKNKKVQNILVLILFLGILFLGSHIRLLTLPNLTDPTTNDYTPLDLDSYYFLRQTQVLLENEFKYPGLDVMRASPHHPPFAFSTLPYAVAILFQIIQVFDDSKTVMYANIISPLIFFIFGLIAFFFMAYVLTKNKWIALISSFFVSIIPIFLVRTLVGSSDHDSFGMMAFFLAIFVFYHFFSKIQEKKYNFLLSGVFGLIAGFFSMFSISAWGGSGAYIFMVFPLVFLINWLINQKSNNWENFSFYALFIFGTLLSTFLFRHTFLGILQGYMVHTSGIFTFLALIFSFFHLVFSKHIKGNLWIKKNSKISSIISSIIIGALIYQIFIGNVWGLILNFLGRIITPFGEARVAVTVAENFQPYLNDLIGQLGRTMFYVFFLGILIFGWKISQGIENKRKRFPFFLTYSLFILGLLFTRISPSSILNGENFISKALMFITFLIFISFSIYIYNKEKWEIDSKWIFLAVLSIILILSVRSAIRVFFVIAPFICLIATIAVFELFNSFKKSKDEIVRVFLLLLLIFIVLNLILVSVRYIQSNIIQAENSHPPYNRDWQTAMYWVRENTPKDSLFLHWWDYGYWVQTGGKRATIADGGHAHQAFNANHKIGRYVLTTPYPETAKSFMKSFNVTHLLIDPTDIGKYPAYSSIADDKEFSDRASVMLTFISDPREIMETRNGITRVYRGGVLLDEDLIYERDGRRIFLPRGIAGIGGVIINKLNNSYSQPIGVYIHQGIQHELEIRFLYVQNELIDFGDGVNATAYVYANVIDTNAGQQVDLEGAMIYLSERTKDSLVAKLYLMNDPNNEYPELELVYSESPYPFFLNYRGFRGPIKIWEVNRDKMENILVREEFYNSSGEYGGLDNLQFIK